MKASLLQDSKSLLDTPQHQQQSVQAKVDATGVQAFLDSIASGRQDEAEVMLKANKELAFASGSVTDHANRTFKNITGFQYAVWSLDWKMWSMLLQYLPTEAAIEQANGFTQGSWVSEHGEHTNWENLIDALKIFSAKLEGYGSWSWDQLGKHWIEQVGSAQLKLPMHVLQEYNNPNRPFKPCPKFSTEYTLRRSLPEWLETCIKEGKFDFGILRSRSSVANPERVMSVAELFKKAFSDGRDWTTVMEGGRGGWLLKEAENIQHDRVALTRLYDIRIRQRDQLVKTLLEEKSKAEAEAEQTGKAYLDSYISVHNQCTLHLFSQAPQSLVFEQAPALVFEKNSFELIVKTNAGLQRIKELKGIEIKTLTEFFLKNKDQKKITLPSEHPIIKWIKLSGHNSSILDVNNNTALHYAAMKGQVALIETLSRYEDYNAQNKMGLTPLLVAAQYGKLEMVMELLSKAPKSAIAQNDLLSVLVSNEQKLIFNEILKDKNRYQALLVNVGQFHLKNNDNPPDIKLMKEAAIGQMYKTALNAKSITMLEFLIQIHPEGLNILYKGQSPLHNAIQTKFIEAVHLLVDKGSDLALQNANKLRPLELAQKEKSDLVNYLTNEEGKAEKRKKEIEQKKIEIEKNRITFVKEFLESFCKQKLPEQKTFLQNSENLGRLNEVLTQAIKETNYDNWFVSEEYSKLTILMQMLNEMLIQKIHQNALTKKRLRGCDLFKKSELSAALQEVLKFNWQSLVIEVKEDKEQEEIKEQSETMVFKTLSPTQVVFCEHFEKQFDEAYSYFRALHSGELVAKKDLEEKQKMEALKVLATPLPNIPIPIANVSIPTASVVSGALTLMQYFKEYYRQKEAACMVNLFRAVTPYERTHFIRYTAEQIAYKYSNQIHHLMPSSEGVEVFAQCAAARVVEYITSDESHQKGQKPSIMSEVIRRLKSWVLKQEIPPELQQQKSLYDIFLDGIIRVTSKFPTDGYRLQTINHLTLTDNWCSKEIFENTGIITPSGERYALPQVDVERYGYCYGTLKEAENRGLSSGPKKDELWGLGRQWEQVKQTQGLDAIPANHVQQSRVLILSSSSNKPNTQSANTPRDKKESKQGIKN